MKKNFMVLTLIVLMFSAVPASAIPFGFSCITNNTTNGCAIGESQFAVDVIDLFVLTRLRD